MKKNYLFIISSLFLLFSCDWPIEPTIERDFFGCWSDEQKREICIGQNPQTDSKLESRSYEGKDSSTELNSLKGKGEFETFEKDKILMIYLKEIDGKNVNERRCAKYTLYKGKMILSNFITTTNDSCNLTKEDQDKTTKWIRK